MADCDYETNLIMHLFRIVARLTSGTCSAFHPFVYLNDVFNLRPSLSLLSD